MAYALQDCNFDPVLKANVDKFHTLFNENKIYLAVDGAKIKFKGYDQTYVHEHITEYWDT